MLHRGQSFCDCRERFASRIALGCILHPLEKRIREILGERHRFQPADGIGCGGSRVIALMQQKRRKIALQIEVFGSIADVPNRP